MDNGNPPAPAQTVNSNKDYNKKVESKTNYALTVTFKHLHCKTPRGQFVETMPYLSKLLHQSTIYSICVEWRHTTGDIHAHCIIKITDHIKWLKQTLPSLKRLGYILVKPIDNELKWMDYMTKEIAIARNIVPECDFPIEKPLKIVKKKDIKKYREMDDYILECLQEAVPTEADTKSEDEVSVQEEVKDSNVK